MSLKRFFSWLRGDTEAVDHLLSLLTGKGKGVYLFDPVSVLIQLFIAVVINVGSALLRKKKRFNTDPAGIQDNISDPQAPLPIVLGKYRVGGTPVYKGASGENNKYLWIVYNLAEEECAGFDTDAEGDLIWLDDKRLSEYGEKVAAVVGWYLSLKDITGGAFQVGDTITGDISGATAIVSEVRDNGITVTDLVGSFAQDSGNPMSDNNWETIHNGTGVSARIVLFMDGVWGQVPGGTSRVQVWFFPGTGDQAVCADLQAALPEWTDRKPHTCYAVVRYEYDENVFTGVPTFNCLLKGKVMTDPRTSLSGWTDNPAIMWRWWIQHPRLGMGLTDDEIYASKVNDAINTCELYGWKFNGVINEQQDFLDNFQLLEDCFRAETVWEDGKYYPLILDYDTPVMDLVEADDETADFVGKLGIEPGGLTATPTKLKVWYPDPNQDYTMESLPIYDSEVTPSPAGNDVLQEIKLIGLADVELATEFGNYYFERLRANDVISGIGVPRTQNLLYGNIVTITSARLGWVQQRLRVTTANIRPDNCTDLVFELEDERFYNKVFDIPEQNIYQTTLPDPFAAPSEITDLVLTEDYEVLPDQIVCILKLSWTHSTYPFGKQYEIWYCTEESVLKLHGTTTDNEYEIRMVSPGTYGVKVITVSTNITSARSQGVIDTLEIQADYTPPAPTDLKITAIPTISLSLSWSWDWPDGDPDVIALVRYKLLAECPPCSAAYSFFFADAVAYGDANGILTAYANALREMGITDGIGIVQKLLFCPSDTITREQGAKFLVGAWNGVTTILPPAQSGATAYFTGDGTTIAADLVQYVNLLKEKGITRGCSSDGTSFCPTRVFTRKEAAVWVIRLYNVRLGYTPDYALSTAGEGVYFDDVTAAAHGDYLYHINKLQELASYWGIDITTGEGTFSPDASINRIDLALWIIKALGQAGSGAATDANFLDVTAGQAPWANKLYELGGTTGCGTKLLFAFSSNIQRQHAALMLAQVLGITTDDIALADQVVDRYYDDLADDSLHSPWFVNHMTTKGWIEGTGTRVFSPAGTLTRKLFVQWIIKAIGESPSTVAFDKYFSDVANDTYAKYINRAFELGITVGTSSTTFSPDSLCTRGQAVAFVLRALYRSQLLTYLTDKSYLYTLPDKARVASFRVYAGIESVTKYSLPVQASYAIPAPAAAASLTVKELVVQDPSGTAQSRYEVQVEKGDTFTDEFVVEVQQEDGSWLPVGTTDGGKLLIPGV